MIILDTAAWIWLTSDPSQLSENATEAIEADSNRGVSAISAWEVGVLSSKQRIRLDRPADNWVDQAMRANGVTLVPLDHEIATLSTMLPANPPNDPADRMIIATALRLGVPLITPDASIRDYPFCPTIW